MSTAYSSLSIYTECSEGQPDATTHDQTLLQNDTIASISIHACGRSFSLPVLVRFATYLYSFSALLPIRDNLLVYQASAFSVTFTLEA